jgi:hypothetical protein
MIADLRKPKSGLWLRCTLLLIIAAAVVPVPPQSRVAAAAPAIFEKP